MNLHETVTIRVRSAYVCLARLLWKPWTGRPDWRFRLRGSTVAFAGYLLSPLSWWNDLFVKMPLRLRAGRPWLDWSICALRRVARLLDPDASFFFVATGFTPGMSVVVNSRMNL